VPGLRLTLDVGHALQAGLDPSRFVADHFQYLVNVHLHDGISQGRAHLALGEGELDIKALSASMMGYLGFVGLEVLTDRDLQTSCDYLRAELGWAP
jgi:sugar phosphate isomerase/epimerase